MLGDGPKQEKIDWSRKQKCKICERIMYPQGSNPEVHPGATCRHAGHHMCVQCYRKPVSEEPWCETCHTEMKSPYLARELKDYESTWHKPKDCPAADDFLWSEMFTDEELDRFPWELKEWILERRERLKNVYRTTTGNLGFF